MKVDFRKFPVYTSIRKDKTKEVDISEVIANTIYTTRSGVMAHSLAMRIYEQGEVELNDKEKEVVLQVADGFVGVVTDSIKEVLK